MAMFHTQSLTPEELWDQEVLSELMLNNFISSWDATLNISDWSRSIWDYGL